jgi:hypothetical protein
MDRAIAASLRTRKRLLGSQIIKMLRPNFVPFKFRRLEIICPSRGTRKAGSNNPTSSSRATGNWGLSHQRVACAAQRSKASAIPADAALGVLLKRA